MAGTNHMSGRILVVDDQQANLQVVSTLLSRHGYDVVTAQHGETALESGDGEFVGGDRHGKAL